MDNNYVNFRYGTPVTINPLFPALEPGTFSFDSESLALYLDTDTKRVQIKDPLKLSLTGGTLTGDLLICDNGVTTSSIHAAEGIVRGQYLETTGDIHLNVPADNYAIIDGNGRIRSRTKSETLADLGISSLGALAHKDTASGIFTPEGRVTAPTILITSSTGDINSVSRFSPGELPSFTVESEVLQLDEGELPELETEQQAVMLTIDSIQVSEPEFIGTTATITVG